MISPAFPDLDWDLATTTLGPGERLFAYTDGVLEARSESGELFGEPRLSEQLARPELDLCGRVRRAAEEHVGGRPIDDDLTLLTVRRT